MNTPFKKHLQINEISKICRICLNTNVIINILNGLYQNIQLTNIFETVFRESVNINDKAAISLCQNCLNSLIHSYHFVDTYKRNKPILEQLETIAASVNITDNPTVSCPKEENGREVEQIDIKEEGVENKEEKIDIENSCFIKDNVIKDHDKDIKKHCEENTLKKHSYFCHFCQITIETFQEVVEHYNEKNHRIADKCMLCNKQQKHVHTHLFSHRPKSLRYVCYVCSLFFKNREEWEKHNSEINHKRIKCRICGKEVDRRAMFAHIRAHAAGKSFECDLCGNKYKERGGLRRHREAIHEGIRYYCDKCAKAFTTMQMLKTHVENKHSDGSKTVTKAKRKYSNYSFKNGKKVSYNLSTCEICGKSLYKYNKKKMALHEAFHKFGHKYICKVPGCLKTFPDVTGEEDHKKADHERFPCEECSHVFYNIDRLKTHSYSHIWANNYTKSDVIKCFICNEQFSNVEELTQHLLKQYGVHLCTNASCFKVFSHKITLQQHTLMLHSNNKRPIKRTVKTEKIASAAYEKRPFACKDCNKRFAQKKNLQIHSSIHTGDKPYKCQYCEKRFVLSNQKKIHERTHTGEKVFACEKCDKRFALRKSLIIHKNALCIYSKSKSNELSENIKIEIKEEK